MDCGKVVAWTVERWLHGPWNWDNGPHLNLGVSFEVSGPNWQVISWIHSFILPTFNFQLSSSSSTDMETSRDETGGWVDSGRTQRGLMPEEMLEENNIQDLGKDAGKHETHKLVAWTRRVARMVSINSISA